MASAASVEPEKIDLKNPLIAGILAWLVPGLGHWYQGRFFKAVLFAVCILGTFSVGLYLGGSPARGWGRVVYLDLPQPLNRPHFFCQLGAGAISFPAIFQAWRARDGVQRDGFMYPPLGEAQLDVLNLEFGRYFELATVYTMIAGLLNILAVFDAAGGPVYILEDRDGTTGDAKSPPQAEVDKLAPITREPASTSSDATPDKASATGSTKGAS